MTSLIFFVIAGVLLMSGYRHDKRSADDEILTKMLANAFDAVRSQVASGHPKEADFALLSESPYDVLIEDQDSAIYWNNYISGLHDRHSSTEDYLIAFKDINGGHRISIGLDLSIAGRLNQYLQKEYDLTLTSATDYDHQATLTDYQSNTINVYTKVQQHHSLWGQLSFFAFLIGVLLLFYWHARTPKPHRKRLQQGTAIILGLLLVTHLLLPLCYADTYLASLINVQSHWCPDIMSLLSYILIATFGISIIRSTRLLHRLPYVPRLAISTFLITLTFFVLCYLAQGFLLSQPLGGGGRLLQYSLGGLIYLLVFSFALSAIFYGSVVAFGQLQEGQSSALTRYGTILATMAATIPFGWMLSIGMPLWTLYVFIFAFFLIIELYVENEEKSIIYTIWWLIIFAGFLSSITFYYQLQNTAVRNAAYAASLYHAEKDTHTRAIRSIDSLMKASEVFPQLSSLRYPSGLDKDDFQDYVVSIITSGQLTRSPRAIEIEATDQQGITIFNNHFSQSYTLVESISKSDRLSEHIFYNPFENQYYLRYNIENTDYNDAPFTLLIQVALEDRPKSMDTEVNYVIMKNDAIIDNEILDPFPMDYKAVRSIDSTQINGDISYAVYKPDQHTRIIAFEKIGGLIKPISLFSFILSLTGILLFIVSMMNTRFRFMPRELNLQFSQSSSLRTKIQLAIIMLILFSFVIIGVMTAYYFRSVLENYNNEDQREDVTSIRNDIRNSIEGVDNNLLASSAVQAKIDEMSLVHDKDLAFFDSDGRILQSSFTDPKIERVPFEIIRAFVNPGSAAAANRIALQDGEHVIEFFPAFYKSQKNPYGYLGISYRPINNSSSSIRDFLSTILNVYVFLFLIAGALAIAIGNSITKPLAILSNKLKEFKLGKTNKVLDWDTKDEIGNLINEYNLLTEKLDESVSILARTERDVAWREMAKQVAHEIKNPLTPMKLSIQYLEKSVRSNPEQAVGMIERVSSTLIEQINNLNQIANEFSNFATMPKASNEKIVINEIVEAIHDLFRKREDMDIQMTEPIDDLFVFADRNHLVRILNNIVKNAIQAIPTSRKGVIKMSLQKVGDMAVVSVRDNGSGIPDHMKDKVFTPNFTTKSSGTGLGLAISANMIESFNGRIYFETEVGVGTEFFIEIPLMRLQHNYPDDVNRVTLD